MNSLLNNTISAGVLYNVVIPVFFFYKEDRNLYEGEIYFKFREYYQPLSIIAFENFGINYVEFI